MKSLNTSFMRVWKVAGALEAERHDEELKMPMMRAKRRLVDVGGGHEHLVVAAAQVQLREESGAAQLIEQLLDDRNWEHIPHRGRIQGAVVDVEAPCPVVLLHQQNRRRECGRARSDDSLL
jgi:hypothetical protein